ncbi:hypothetical protein Esti_006596 [Eimeria stiedai]
MRRVAPVVALLATTAVAFAADSSRAAEPPAGSILGEEGSFADGFASVSGVPGQAAGSGSGESVVVQVAEIQAMDESELNLELRSMYSTSKEALEKLIYPVGSLEAMQDVLSALGSVDEEQRDLARFMNRFAYLLGKVLHAYSDFFKVKVALGDPQLGREAYKAEVAKLSLLAEKWTHASDLLVAFLTHATTDLRDKWDQSATTERRLREVLNFLEKLRIVYETQQKLFRLGYVLAQLRYTAHPDRQADLTLLLEDPRYKQAVGEYEAVLEDIQEKTHRARMAGLVSVKDGILPSEYLTLLPFPPDKQREEDDLPRDEIFALQGPRTQCFSALALVGAGTLNSMGFSGERVSRPPAQPKSIYFLKISKAHDSSAKSCSRSPYASVPSHLPMRVRAARSEEVHSAPYLKISERNGEAWPAFRSLVKALCWPRACTRSPLRLALVLICAGALVALCSSTALFVSATQLESPRYSQPGPPPPANAYAAYSVRGYAAEPAYYIPPVVYGPQPPAVLDLRVRPPPPPPPQFSPYTYGYGYTPTPEQTRQALRLAGAPEPFIATPYDYTKDFLKSLQSIKELKDPAVRTSMLALKELASTRPGSIFGDEEVKVVVLWKRYDEKWGLSVSLVQLPQGHNPTLHEFSKVFLLNASMAASSKCAKSWYRMRLKAEAKLQSGPEMIKPLKQEDIMTPLRSFKELRLVLEDVPSSKVSNYRCFTRTLYKRFGDFLPVTMYETLPAVSVKVLVLKPVSVERHVSDESAPFEDGPVVYSFESPYKTSFVRELQIPFGSNPTLYRIAKLYLQHALHLMKGCSIANASLVPSFAAIAKDESGKVHVLPLSNLDTPLRALGWAAAEGEAESGRELTVNLVLFLRNILKSEAAKPCFEANFRHSMPEEIGEKMHVMPVWVTTHCEGLLLKKCKRKVFEVHFSDTKVTVRDALMVLRMHMQLGVRRREPSTCFVGRARIKRRVARSVLPGHPWKDIPPGTLLMDISRLKSGVLLAPASSLFVTDTAAAHTICPSFVSILQHKDPIIIQRLSHGITKHPMSAFGPNSINVFE